MKKIVLVVLSIIIFTACQKDDDAFFTENELTTDLITKTQEQNVVEATLSKTNSTVTTKNNKDLTKRVSLSKKITEAYQTNRNCEVATNDVIVFYEPGTTEAEKEMIRSFLGFAPFGIIEIIPTPANPDAEIWRLSFTINIENNSTTGKIEARDDIRVFNMDTITGIRVIYNAGTTETEKENIRKNHRDPLNLFNVEQCPSSSNTEIWRIAPADSAITYFTLNQEQIETEEVQDFSLGIPCN